VADRTIVIAGATGVVGNAALEHFAAQRSWTVVALSRRKPECEAGPFRHIAVDLRDEVSCRDTLSRLQGVTSVIYAALYEKPGLIRGWYERDQMETNLAMLRNCLEPLRQQGTLRHVSLLQGTKAYGVHHHPIAVPAREDSPRDAHENFYWLQEDYLKDIQRGASWSWTIFRPQIVFGYSLGTAMNLIPVIGAYAAICREEGLPFAFPGGASTLLEATDARLLARAFDWAAATPACANQIFNITNGDVFVWRNVWPAIAASLGLEPAPDAPLELKSFLPSRADVWDRIVAKHQLRPTKLIDLLGESHHYADFCFAFGAKDSPPPAIVSTVKARSFGFADCLDTEDMFRHWFAEFASRRVLPTVTRRR
jgi:nucleoside-diphosphate-sugar epimerase